MDENQQVGRYRLCRRLAVGGMGEVHLAAQTGPAGFEKLVVLKRMLPSMASDRELVKLFLDEARLVARLNHRNISQVIELAKDGDGYFVAMEYVPGPSLAAVIDRLAETRATLPPAIALEIAMQVAEALDYAHSATNPDGTPLSIVHRDVTPGNILLSVSGDVKLIDFGVAKSSQQEHSTLQGGIKGKLAYMSPEQARGQKVDGRSDLFALGVVLYEMLSGANPFQRGDPVQTLMAVQLDAAPALAHDRPHLAACDPLLAKMLAKRANDRPANGNELREQLKELKGRFAAPVKQLGAFVSGMFGEEIAALAAGTLASPSPKPGGSSDFAPISAIEIDTGGAPTLIRAPAPLPKSAAAPPAAAAPAASPRAATPPPSAASAAPPPAHKLAAAVSKAKSKAKPEKKPVSLFPSRFPSAPLGRPDDRQGAAGAAAPRGSPSDGALRTLGAAGDKPPPYMVAPAEGAPPGTPPYAGAPPMYVAPPFVGAPPALEAPPPLAKHAGSPLAKAAVVVIGLAAFIAGGVAVATKTNKIGSAIEEVATASPLEKAVKLAAARALIANELDASRAAFYRGGLEEAQGRPLAAVSEYSSGAKGGNSSARQRLIDLLKHEDCQVRQEAARAVGELKLTAAKSALERLANSGGAGDTEAPIPGGCDSSASARMALRNLKRN